MNSSFENSCFEKSVSQLADQDLDKNHLASPKVLLYKGVNYKMNSKFESRSTPIRTQCKTPFKCTLSPIGNWENRKCGGKTSEHQNDHVVENTKFTTSPITKICIDVDYVQQSSKSQHGSSKDELLSKSTCSLVLENIKARRSRKNVCFDANVNSPLPKISQGSSSRKSTQVVLLQPGKWRKSLNLWRRTQSIPSG